ncbi:MAG: hypothetical protein JNK87_09870 [Bryobacterales bacterium]|nr:hypothetical protein [Bryobacterales bacterium]
MNIELYSLLATLVLVATLASVVFAFASYMLFRIREHRKLQRKKASVHAPAPAPAPTPVAAAAPIPEPARPRFFKPYEPAN